MFARLSFISFCIAFLAFLLVFVHTILTGYTTISSTFLIAFLQGIVTLLIFIAAPFSIITAVISFVKKEANQVLPTIPLSIGSFCVIVLGLVVLQSYIKPIHVTKATVTNCGIFNIPTSDTDSTKVLYDLRFLENNTNIIPAIKGLRFCFNYVISGEPDAEYVDVQRITRYPKPGLVKYNHTILADTSLSSVSLNDLRYYGFRFDYDYELVPGTWEFEYSYKDTVLFTQRFNVVKPNPDK